MQLLMCLIRFNLAIATVNPMQQKEAVQSTYKSLEKFPFKAKNSIKKSVRKFLNVHVPLVERIST